MTKFYQKLIDFFLVKTNIDKDTTDYQKAKTLTGVMLLAGGLLLVLIAKILIADGIRPALIPMSVFFVVMLMLGVIYSGRPKFTGNLLSLIFLVLMIFSMYANPKGSGLPYYMLGQYYIFFVIIVFAAMFANKTVFLICTFASIFSTVHIFILTQAQIPENVRDISDYGIFVYEIMLILVALFSYFFATFIDKAISVLSEKSQKITEQNRHLKDLAEKVAAGSKELYLASNQLNIISQRLSENTNKQASVTEEISASVSDMLSAIRSNSEYTEDTKEISSRSAERLEANKQQMLAALEAVKRINDRVGIISDVVFQTNILSLNASIQASHAGDRGAGFSVVAREIRDLSDRTKNASVDIIKLSSDNKKIAQEASIEIEKLLPEIFRLKEHITAISDSGQKQKDAAESVNLSLQQLAQAANSNSASAEEMTASAQQLTAQAEQLKEISTQFEN